MTVPWLGLLGAVGIGLSLGLLGSGGSIVTVPVLVYLFGQATKDAVAGSLLVVALVATAGALLHARRQSPAWRVALLFAPTGMLGAWIGALLSGLVGETTQMRSFAAAMLLAAALMLRPPAALRQSEGVAANDGSAPPAAQRWHWLLLLGACTGLLTGFVGVGGGFMVVPALVLGARLPMAQAVGTSLLLIALNAATGFAGQWQAAGARGLWHLDYAVLAAVTVLGILGTVAGQRIAHRLPAVALRRVFASCLMLLGGFLLWQGSPG
ncbi:MAG: hypothetical protein RL026_74 [Pseudomonadota bacterium]|jgi:uncharacterized membrane protein YfcA